MEKCYIKSDTDGAEGAGSIHSVSNTKSAYRMKKCQGQYWMLTIPFQQFTPYLPPDVAYTKGQLEQGKGEFKYLHWQIIVYFAKRVYSTRVKDIYGDGIHVELTKSTAAEQYVWKDDTSITGTRFELGTIPFRRQIKRDWDSIWESAKTGALESIDKSVLVPYYNAIKRIRQDHLEPIAMERTCHVFWGDTGTGKSRRAWGEAGMDAYPKDPRTKFWDGYNGQKHVVMDEFRGAIDIGHLLRWLDRYPVIVEVKGSSTVFKAETIWITSNVDPRSWYDGLDEKTREALLRRLKITHFNKVLGQG